MRESVQHRSILKLVLVALSLTGIPALLSAQGPPPPYYSPRDIDDMVTRIALYPDPLIAQVLAAATYPDQIQDAARWADDHHYLRGDELARAIESDQLPWDPSVQSLLPFPSVLEMMASDMNWTSALGNAFLGQQQEVMDAVQRMRRRARDYGYLRSNGQVIVSGGSYITILPANPGYVCVPVYDPHVVFVAPRPGFYVGGAVGFGFGIALGAAFRPWGWGESRFAWDRHEVYVGESRWGRTWVNRTTYVHPYHGVERWNGPPRRVEEHERIVRSEAERNAAYHGYARPEERHYEQHHDNGNHGNPHQDYERRDNGHHDNGHHDHR